MSTRTILFDKPGFGKPRKLRYDVNSVADVEQLLQMGLSDLFQQRAGMLTTRGLLWAGLKHEERTLTPEKVGAMMLGYLQEGGKLEELMALVSEAIAAAGLFPRADAVPGEEDESDPNPKGQTIQ